MRKKPEISEATLWTEDLPYSQAYLTREIRIVGDEVSRVFYYVHADINPATFEILSRHRKEINKDFVDDFLDQAKPGPDGGYQWAVYGREAIDEEEAREFEEGLTKRITEMHKIVSQLIEKHYNDQLK
ncbi:MAG: hypothetical protein KDK30_04550 [Leptospiraceae bacterium]|nr:hypothetical protein [Leptospiraceae bacterium]MCB1314555.1 hypothetical protein [Leptospiraceae bacterium]